jgi:hypothetical protein
MSMTDEDILALPEHIRKAYTFPDGFSVFHYEQYLYACKYLADKCAEWRAEADARKALEDAKIQTSLRYSVNESVEILLEEFEW